MTAATINLNGVIFSPQETVLITMGDMTASTLRYASGVAGLRIKNRVGEITILPFLGQQVWDATFHGRRLTMRSMFEEPVDTCDYLRNYGAFLLHCGATAMGNPSAGDTHPLHGELPNARYQRAELLLGADDEGSYMEVRGSYRHTVAFSHNYVAKPCLRIHETSSKLDLHMQINNLKNSPMDLMYLAHVNFRPVDGATLVDTAPDDPSHIRIRTHVPEFFMPTATHRVLIDSLLKDPSLLSPEARAITAYPGGHNEGFPDTFKQLAAKVYAYIRKGDFDAPTDFPTFMDGHYELQLCEAIEQSAKEQRWINIK